MIGALARRVALERPERVEDEGGGASVLWTPVATVWASVISAGLGERASFDSVAGRVSHRLRVRWRSDLAPGWRARIGERVLRIESAVDRDAARRWLHLDCIEEVR